MADNLNRAIAVIGIDIGKNSVHVVGLDHRGAIVLRQKWSRGQVDARFANMPPCLIGMEACVGAHHLSRKLKGFGHDARLMPARYVRPYSKGQKNDFRDAEAIAEAVQRPTMKFVATKTADQLDLQALHRVRERLAEHAEATGLHRSTVSVGLVGALFEVVLREYQRAPMASQSRLWSDRTNRTPHG
jgi:transposase